MPAARAATLLGSRKTRGLHGDARTRSAQGDLARAMRLSENGRGCRLPGKQLAHIDACVYTGGVNSSELRRYLAKQGRTFEPGKGGHLIVRRGERRSVLPQHGGRKQLGGGLVRAILRDLGLE